MISSLFLLGFIIVKFEFKKQMNQAQVEVSLLQLAGRCRSKKEVYQFMTLEGGAYMPKIASVNMFFLKQVFNNEKKVLQITC